MQWLCPCTWSNSELRKRCRNCGEPRLPHEVMITENQALLNAFDAGEIELEFFKDAPNPKLLDE